MTWKLEPGLRVAIKATLEVHSEYEHGSEGREACDEILRTIHMETDQRSMGIAEQLDDLPH